MAEERNPLYTRFCEMFDLEYPIAAFSHCADTIYEVANAGGLGVLGMGGEGGISVEGKTNAEQLDEGIRLIKSKTSAPFAVDFLLPGSMPAGVEKMTAEDILKIIPPQQRQFVEKLRKENDIPEYIEGFVRRIAEGFTAKAVDDMLQVVFDHKVPIFAAALGSPPQIIERLHKEGMKVISLVGKTKHVPKVIAAGADVIVAQGYDAGGHTGEIGTMSLVPQIVDAVKAQAPHIPVLAAGGIMDGRGLAAALALGGEGIWTGTIWQLSLEHHLHMQVKQRILNSSQDQTLRQKYLTGKTCRVIRNAFVDAWEKPDSPPPLGMPLQTILGGGFSFAAQSVEKWDYVVPIAGQGTGMVKKLRSCRDIIMDYVEGALEVMDKFQLE
jgi:NAD(P)H-dependent flavin oxidoreductase YrpB (nitropropane dioxygenase family)